MTNFINALNSIWYFFIIIPFITIFVVEGIKLLVIKDNTEEKNTQIWRFVAWGVSTLLWAFIILTMFIKIEHVNILNIIGPGIIMGMISNAWYDLG